MSPIGFKSQSRLTTDKTTLTLPKKSQKARGSLEPRTLLAFPRGDDKSIGQIAHRSVGRRDLLGGRPHSTTTNEFRSGGHDVN